MTLNTNATTSWRKKWMPNLLQEILRNALVTEKICAVDTSDVFYIENPYGSAGSVTQQAIVGTYSVATYTSTTDTLTLTDEFVWSEHIYSTEKVAQIADIKGSRMKEAMGQMAESIDKWILNALTDAGTGAYTTPAGGFQTSGNVPTIFSKLGSKLAGYATNFSGKYCVVEAADTAGITLSGMSTGFNFADDYLNNGFGGKVGGFDVFVVQDGTFVTATLGTGTYTNSGHRVAGIKGISTILRPGGKMEWMEKEVSGKRGVELALAADVGFKAWFQKLALTIDITLA